MDGLKFSENSERLRNLGELPRGSPVSVYADILIVLICGHFSLSLQDPPSWPGSCDTNQEVLSVCA